MRRFTIVARPNYQDPNTQEEWNYFFPPDDEKSWRTRLRAAPQDPLNEALKALIKESEDSLKLIHPSSPNLSTVCVWEQEDKYYVKSSNDLTAFDRPDSNNLLYLPTLKGKKLIDFRDINNYNATYRYQVIEPEEIQFLNSLATKKSRISGVFFKQVKSDEGGNSEIIDLDILDESQDEYHAVGWLNPVILTFALDKNDIESIEKANKKEYLYALKLFLDSGSLILVEPHIDESYDLRISFLIKLNQLIQEYQQSKPNNKNLSLIEYLLFGSQYSQPWKPFFILDLLEGEFYAYQKQWENQGREKLLVAWKSPQDAQSNKLWFADYWLKQWVNLENIDTQSEVDVVPPPSLARPYRPSKGLVTFKVDDLSYTNVSLTSLLSKHPQFISDYRANNPYRFLFNLFQDSEQNSELKKSLEKFPYNNFWRIESQQNKLVKFDDADFWNYFIKTHVVPESPILIAIPNHDNRFLDPIRSVNFGAYHFLWSLFNCLDSSREKKIVEFHNDFGWWNDWHLTIFNESWNVSLKFIKQSGFIIQESFVGKDCLGFKTNQVDWKYSNMRFSRPLKNNLL